MLPVWGILGVNHDGWEDAAGRVWWWRFVGAAKERESITGNLDPRQKHTKEDADWKQLRPRRRWRRGCAHPPKTTYTLNKKLWKRWEKNQPMCIRASIRNERNSTSTNFLAQTPEWDLLCCRTWCMRSDWSDRRLGLRLGEMALCGSIFIAHR